MSTDDFRQSNVPVLRDALDRVLVVLSMSSAQRKMTLCMKDHLIWLWMPSDLELVCT